MTSQTKIPDAIQVVRESHAYVTSNPPNFIGDAAMLPHSKQAILDACRFLSQLRDPGSYGAIPYLRPAEELIQKVTTEWHQIDAADKDFVARLNRKPHLKLDHEVAEFMPIVRKYMRRALLV